MTKLINYAARSGTIVRSIATTQTRRNIWRLLANIFLVSVQK
ncbi:hypothetical protein QUA41_06340 [Microcoleus sp. Pol11C1]